MVDCFGSSMAAAREHQTLGTRMAEHQDRPAQRLSHGPGSTKSVTFFSHARPGGAGYR